MAELNNELDLTAPAAPTLTLDPIADEAAEAQAGNPQGRACQGRGYPA